MPTLVTSGQLTITDQNDPVNAFISNAAFVVATDSGGGNGNYSGCETTMSVFLGSADVSANWSIAAAASSGVTGSLSGRTYTVTSLTADTGYVDLTASALGFTSVTRRFSLSKSKTGAAGKNATLISVKGDETNANVAGFSGRGFTYNGTTDITASRGHMLVVFNPAAGAIISGPTAYDTYGYGTGGLVTALNSLAAGSVIAIYSFDATACDSALRTALQGFGSPMTTTWGASRVAHVFIGQKGAAIGSAYEATGSGSTVAGVVSVSAFYTASGLVLNGGTGATGTSGLNFSEAKSLYLDPTFQSGQNSVGLYDNTSGGNTIITREAKQTDSPYSDSGYNLKISNIGAASPYLGGFYHNINSRANAVFVQRFIAKIPTGYYLSAHSNAIGDNASNTWLTSTAGTGRFEEYILVRRCGATGTFSSSGHIALVGTAGTAQAPVNWYLAYCAVYDFSAIGFANVTGALSNESHAVPADNAGNNGNFTGAATTMTVYNGATNDSANWTVTAAASTGVTGSLSGNTYTVSAMSVDAGYVDLTAARSGYASVVKRFTLTKAKAGVQGVQGVQGPAVSITASRPASFTSTDGTLDSGQGDITYTATVSGIASPTYVWTFSGLQTNPTASTTATQTITAAQFGTSKSATVTCTVSGTYKDTESIVRLEKSTAAAGATVGAPSGTYVGGNPVDVDGMKSPNYVAGSAGWKLGDDGSAEFDSASIRGQITAEQLDAGAIRGKQITGQMVADIGAMVTKAVAKPVDEFTPAIVSVGNTSDFPPSGGLKIYSTSSSAKTARFTSKTETTLTVIGLTGPLLPGDLLIPGTPVATAQCSSGAAGNFGSAAGKDFPQGATNLILYSKQNGYFSGSYSAITHWQETSPYGAYYAYFFESQEFNNEIPFSDGELVFATPNYGFPIAELSGYYDATLTVSIQNCAYVPKSGNAILVNLDAAPGSQSVFDIRYSSYSGSTVTLADGCLIQITNPGTYTLIPYQTSVVIGSYDQLVANSSLFSGASSTTINESGISTKSVQSDSVRATSTVETGMLTVTKNIQFPYTQVASSNANNLDDYEEGAFTPTIIGSTTAGVGAYTDQVGRYTKIGNRVFYHIRLGWSGHTGAGSMRISGLPFVASGNGAICPGGVAYSGLSAGAGKQVSCYPITGSSSMYIMAVDPNGGTNAALTVDTAVAYFAVSGHYEV